MKADSFMSVGQYAKANKVHRNTIYYWIEQGWLDGATITLGKRLFINKKCKPVKNNFIES